MKPSSAAALLFTLFAALFFVPNAVAHPSGTSKIYIHVLPGDSVTVKIDVNAGDVQNLFGSPFIQGGPLDPVALHDYQLKTGSYLFTHLQVTVDHRSFLSPSPISWARNDTLPGEFVWDSTTLFDTSHVVTFAGKMPTVQYPRGADARLLQINTQLFPEFGIQTLSEISVFWKDTLVELKWIGLDKTFRIDVTADSLEARLALTHQAGVEPSKISLFARFITLGFTHILPYGLDHILFVLGLFFFSTRLRPLFMQITAFTIAHTLTVALAVLGVFTLSPAVVDPLISLSIAVVGLENVFFRQVRASRWLIVFFFGLVHGMGFAGALKTFGFPPGGFWPALIGFNGGVELGQMAVIGVVFCLTLAFRRKPWYFKRIVVPISLAISAVALYWAFERVWRIY